MTSFIFYLGGIMMLLHHMYISGGITWLIGLISLVIGFIIDYKNEKEG